MPSKRSLVVLVLSFGLVIGCSTSRPSGSEVARASPSSGNEARSAQLEYEMDREITRQIDDAVRRDPSLASIARSVTIVTLGSVVTLRGNVNSSRERDAIARHARDVAGVQRIENALSVRRSPHP